MLIALIPSLLLTVVEDLNEIISALHFYVCSTYRMYLRIILRIYVLHIYTMNNNIRAFLRFMFLFSLFAGYLFTNSPVILSLLLTIIYLGVYCEYIVSKILDRNQVMKMLKRLYIQSIQICFCIILGFLTGRISYLISTMRMLMKGVIILGQWIPKHSLNMWSGIITL